MPTNAKIHDLGDNEFLEKERFSKVFGETANNMRMKSFLGIKMGKNINVILC